MMVEVVRYSTNPGSSSSSSGNSGGGGLHATLLHIHEQASSMTGRSPLALIDIPRFSYCLNVLMALLALTLS